MLSMKSADDVTLQEQLRTQVQSVQLPAGYTVFSRIDARLLFA